MYRFLPILHYYFARLRIAHYAADVNKGCEIVELSLLWEVELFPTKILHENEAVVCRFGRQILLLAPRSLYGLPLVPLLCRFAEVPVTCPHSEQVERPGGECSRVPEVSVLYGNPAQGHGRQNPSPPTRNHSQWRVLPVFLEL